MMGSWLLSHQPAWDEGAAPSLAVEMTRLVPRWSCSVHKAQALGQMPRAMLSVRAGMHSAPRDGGVEARWPPRAGRREEPFWEACVPHGSR